MKAIRTQFDGEHIRVPAELEHGAPCEVIVLLPEDDEADWQRAQEQALTDVWDNDEDAIYDEA